MNTFKIIGAIGIVLISIGILLRKRKSQNVCYILGGICLEIYSIHLRDTIFMVLEGIFTLTAIFSYKKIR